MKMNASVFLLVSIVSILLTSCGTLEVGIETISPPTPFPSDVPTGSSTIPTESAPPSPEIIPTETLIPAVPDTPDVPELVSIGHLAPFASPDIGVLTFKDDQLSLEPGPVYYEILWDYSPVSGKLAYSSEFFHGSESNNVSVSDLWIYDYQSGTSEKWLEDNVARASWAPDGERVTAAIYNPESEQIELVLVSGPDQVEPIADCASMLYSWSPDGKTLAYVNSVSWAGVKESCAGTYLVSFPNGISSPGHDIQRVSDFGSQKLLSGHQVDKPLWALEGNALIYPDQPLWIVPLDGSPAFIPQTPGGEDPMNLPRPFGNLWSSHLNQLIGNVDTGPAGFGGVWVYQLTEDLSQIDSYFRIGDAPQGDNSFITLVDWWVPGESILVIDGDNLDTSQYLSELWRPPAVWSLLDNQWIEMPNN